MRVPSLPDQVAGNHRLDNAEYTTNQGWIGLKEKPRTLAVAKIAPNFPSLAYSGASAACAGQAHRRPLPLIEGLTESVRFTAPLNGPLLAFCVLAARLSHQDFNRKAKLPAQAPERQSRLNL